MNSLTIGVLALQGAFEKHCEMLQKLEVNAIQVRNLADLEKTDALILPGGESTAISYLIRKNKFENALKNYTKPLYGTCAGLILMAKEVIGNQIQPLGLIDVTVERNAYGRQIHSFKAPLQCLWQGDTFYLEAFFIRAPKIIQLLSSDVEILVQDGLDPVFIKQGMRFASTFHPELTQDTTIHNLFVEFVKSQSTIDSKELTCAFARKAPYLPLDK